MDRWKSKQCHFYPWVLFFYYWLVHFEASAILGGVFCCNSRSRTCVVVSQFHAWWSRNRCFPLLTHGEGKIFVVKSLVVKYLKYVPVSWLKEFLEKWPAWKWMCRVRDKKLLRFIAEQNETADFHVILDVSHSKAIAGSHQSFHGKINLNYFLGCTYEKGIVNPKKTKNNTE